MSRLIGYTRAYSPGEGDAEVDALFAAGVGVVFADAATADVRARPELARCLRMVEPGDVLVVTSAARLSHSVTHYLLTSDELRSRGVELRTIAEPALCIGAELSMKPDDVIEALGGLRRRLVSLQTRSGMTAAAAEGRRPGRPTVMTPERVDIAIELRNLGRPVTHIARVIGVSPNAVHRALASAEPSH